MADELTTSGEVIAADAAVAVATAPDAAKPATTETRPVVSKPAASPATAKVSAAPANFSMYTRNLLNVKVPVSVTLAAKKQPLKQILELAPGSLIQFNKSCDETLELYVGEHCIAKGLAVKVGEKFGLRVNALTSPGERFQAVQLPNK
jgi:flagellar motor switch protein FliN